MIPALIITCLVALLVFAACERIALRRKLDEQEAQHGTAAEHLDHARAMQAAADTLHAEALVLRRDARAELDAAHDALRAQAEGEKRALLDDARAEAARIAAEAQTRAEALLSAYRVNLDEQLAQTRVAREALHAAARDEQARIRDEHTLALRDLRAEHAARLARVETECEQARAEITRLQAEASARTQALRTEHATRVETLRAEHAARLARAGAEVEQSGAERDTARREARAAKAESETLRASLRAVAERYIRDHHAMLLRDMSAANYALSVGKLDKVLEFLAKHGVSINAGRDTLDAELRAAHARAARTEAARAEQARIRELMRDEEKAAREYAAELKRLETQEQAVRKALETALAKATAEHTGEVDRLRARLAELDGAILRTKSLAEQTRAGHVYVLSNLGSFGPEVFKVGMTRRLDPKDRVDELGDASVPFPFDVHMMISCEDAPALEGALHKALAERRVNRVNLRKEFFRTTAAELAALVEAHHGRVDYLAEPEALQYRESAALAAPVL